MMYTICYGVHVNVKTSSRSVRGNGQDHAEMGTGGAADPCGEDSNQPEGLHDRVDCAVSGFTVEWRAGGNQDNRFLPRITWGPESRPEESAASAGGLLYGAGVGKCGVCRRSRRRAQLPAQEVPHTQERLSPEQEMVQDLMTIEHCFSSRLYGLRNYRKKLHEALKQDAGNAKT